MSQRSGRSRGADLLGVLQVEADHTGFGLVRQIGRQGLQHDWKTERLGCRDRTVAVGGEALFDAGDAV